MCSPLKIFLYNSLLELQYLLKRIQAEEKSMSPFPHTPETHGIIRFTLETLWSVVIDIFTCCFSGTSVLNLFIP